MEVAPMPVRSLPNTKHGTLVSHALPAAQQVGSADVRVTSCTSHLHAVRPGDAFIAGVSDGDAHAEAQAALARGAAAIVTERYLPVFGVPQYVVDDAQAAYSELCQAILGHPACDINAIAVAGSYGKTSIALLLDSIFNVAGKSAATATNQFTRIDGSRARFVVPTSAPSIAEFLDESLASGCRQAAVELNEETLRSKAAYAVEFDVVCLSNLHGDHAADDRSPQSCRDAMASALDMLAPHGMAVLNADDSYSMRLFAEHDGPVLTFGMHHPADVSGSIVEQHVNEQVFMLTIGDQSAAVRTRVVGETHVQNCLAAAAIAKVYGVSLLDIVRGIEQVTVVPGVMHRFDAGLGVSVFVDRGENPIAKGSALSAARAVTAGKVHAVVDRRCSVTDALADCTIETTGVASDQVICDAVAKVLAALEITKPKQLRTITEKLTGIARAIATSSEGDVVVVGGLQGPQPLQRRASVSVSEEEIIQSLMHEIAAARREAA